MSPTEDTFVCDMCGRNFPTEQLKEVFEADQKLRLCPEDLDKRMNQASEVYGGPGQEKRRAAYLDEPPKEGATGKSEREEDGPSPAGAMAPPRDEQGTPIKESETGDKESLTDEAEDAISVDLEAGEEVSTESRGG